MSSNSTETKEPSGPRGGTLIVAIIVPSVLIILLIVLIIVGFLLPRLAREERRVRENGWQTRKEELENRVKAQCFSEWAAGQKEKRSGAPQMSDALCAICLDDFADDSQVRGLECAHAFHSHCLDEWYTKYNEYCPLCHGPIIPGAQLPKKKAREVGEPTIPVILMV